VIWPVVRAFLLLFDLDLVRRGTGLIGKYLASGICAGPVDAACVISPAASTERCVDSGGGRGEREIIFAGITIREGIVLMPFQLGRSKKWGS